MCEHMEVTTYVKQVSMATRYEPAEYDGHAQCNECGEVMSLDDVPAGAEEHAGDPDLWDVPEWDDRI